MLEKPIVLVENVERNGVYLVGKGISKLYVVVILEAYAVVDTTVALTLEDEALAT